MTLLSKLESMNKQRPNASVQLKGGRERGNEEEKKSGRYFFFH